MTLAVTVKGWKSFIFCRREQHFLHGSLSLVIYSPLAVPPTQRILQTGGVMGGCALVWSMKSVASIWKSPALFNKPRTSLDILNNTGWCARFYTYTFSMLLIFDQLMFSFIVFIFTIPRIVLLSCMFYLEVLLLVSGGQFIHINSTMIIWAQHVKMRNIYLNWLITGVLFDNQDGYLERLIWNIIWKGERKQKHAVDWGEITS